MISLVLDSLHYTSCQLSSPGVFQSFFWTKLPLPLLLISSLIRNSGGTVGIYFRSRSLSILPYPAPYVSRISTVVGRENCSIYIGSMSRRSEGGSSSSSWMGVLSSSDSASDSTCPPDLFKDLLVFGEVAAGDDGYD